MCLLGVQVVTDNLADLRKVVAMRANRLGAMLTGGVIAGDRAGKPGARVDDDLPPVPIPERFKDALGRYDKDSDGKLSGKEIDAMPERLAQRVREAIRRRLGGDSGRP
jgi:hypothetical protein